MLNSPLATLWKDFLFLFLTLKGKSEDHKRRIRNRASLKREPLAQNPESIPSAICSSTREGRKSTLKYGRAHSTSRAAVVWRRVWRCCSSVTALYPLFSLKGRDSSLVQDNLSTLNSLPSALTEVKSWSKSLGYDSIFNNLGFIPG